VTAPAWVQHVIWWHVYPLGFVGAFPAAAPPDPGEHRLRRVAEWFDHAIALGASGIALGPIFASRTHGYDTTDHYRVDPRLGDDDDFDYLIAEARRRGLRVLLDGVFNHVGVDFPRYRQAAHDAASARWFRGRPGHFHTFEGHGDLLTLNHDNPEVIDYTATDFTAATSDIDVVLDPITGDYSARSLRVLRTGGILVSLLPFAPDTPDEAARIGVRAEVMLVEYDHQGMTVIADLVTRGRLRPVIAATFPLADAAKAHVRGETGHVAGKIVLTVP